jgi:hypothetical protein
VKLLAETAEMLGLECSRCGAQPAEWCRTATGNRCKSLHILRWYAMLRAREEAKRDG